MTSPPAIDILNNEAEAKGKSLFPKDLFFILSVMITLICGALPAWANPANSGDSANLTLAVIEEFGGIGTGTMEGLRKLSWETRQRTSISPSLKHQPVSLTSDELYRFPFAIWRPSQPVELESALFISKLRRYLTSGGTLLVDIQEPDPQGPIFRSIQALLARALPRAPLKEVDREHVFFKTFYLVDQLGGRFNHSTFLYGAEVDGRMALILHPNDLLGALAQDSNDDWLYYAALGERGREYALRVGVNAFMYTLCLDYKQDQVHIPFILKRRR